METIDLQIKYDEEEPTAAAVLVDVMVGERQYCLLMDTGSATTTLKNDSYISTFVIQGTKDTRGVFSARVDELVVAPKVAIGSIEKHHFTVARMTDSSEGVENVLGMDFLRDLCLEFDFEKRRVVVFSEQSWTSGTHNELRVSSAFHPYVDVRFNDVTANALWDTGASMTVVDADFVHDHPAFFELDGESAGTDSTGVTMTTPIYTMINVTIDKCALMPHKVAVVDLSNINTAANVPVHMILGYTSISQARWMFDFHRKRWAIFAGSDNDAC